MRLSEFDCSGAFTYFCIWQALFCGCYGCNACYGTLIPGLDNKLPSSFKLHTVRTDNVIDCAKRCMEFAKCSYITYNKFMAHCQLHSRQLGVNTELDPSTLTLVPGSQCYSVCNRTGHIGDPCEARTDCIDKHSDCRDNVCGCEAGYSFNARNNTCLRKCSVYGEDFYKVSRHRIVGRNKGSLEPSTVDECRHFCLNATFLCLSFEWNDNRNLCHIHAVGLLEVPESDWVSNNVKDYYHRNCAQ